MSLVPKSFEDVVTLTRPAPADYEDKDGNTQTAAANEPRFNYSNGVAQGLLLDASLNETAAINDVPAFNASAGHWVIDADLFNSEPLKGMGLGEVFVGSGKMVVSYSGGTAKVWAGGQAIYTVESYTPVEPTYIVEGGLATIAYMSYKPLAISDADAAALATGDFSVGPYDPLSLFTDAQPGTWIDSSDPSTLFIEASGQTPAAIGDPVGLALDKRLGGLGAELVPNSDFEDNDLSAWDFSSFSSYSPMQDAYISGGNLVLVPPSTGYGCASLLTVLSPGKYYVKISVNASYRCDFRVGTERGDSSIRNRTSVQNSPSGTFVESDQPIHISLIVNHAAGPAEVEYLSARAIPGNHFTQPTTASKPTLTADGLLGDGDDDFMSTEMDYQGSGFVSFVGKMEVIGGAGARGLISGTDNRSTMVYANLNTFWQNSTAGRTEGPQEDLNWHIFTVWSIDGKCHFRVDGVDYGSYSDDIYFADVIQLFTNRDRTRRAPATISEVIAAFNTYDLATVERTEKYLADKHGVPLS